MEIEDLRDSTALLDDPAALKRRWREDGVLFLRGVLPRDLLDRAQARFREALAGEDLIDPAIDDLIWTGNAPRTRRPCDAIGTEVWHEFAELPLLNRLMRIALDDEPVWIPIVGHRSSLPTGPIAAGQDLFAGRHQDSYFTQGMHYVVCWMPIRDAALDEGSFAVAPGMHLGGNFYDAEHKMLVDAVPDAGWHSADFRAGDVLMFDFYTPHATLPNPSDKIRISLDMRAVGASAPRPVSGTVETVAGGAVVIRTDEGAEVPFRITEATYVRDMHPIPRIPFAELDRIASPGARVMATVAANGEATMVRRVFY